MTEINKTKINKYITSFFIYSFLGWMLEVIYAYFYFGEFINRGFLFGPICPIYGFGMLIMILFLNKYKGKYLKLFCISSITLSYFEYIISFILEVLFGLKWWDYTNEFLNINGRICLTFFIAWGVISTIIINFINPFIQKFIDKIFNKFNSNILNIIIKGITTLFLTDIIISIIGYV